MDHPTTPMRCRDCGHLQDVFDEGCEECGSTDWEPVMPPSGARAKALMVEGRPL